jgi:hypothetical protein
MFRWAMGVIFEMILAECGRSSAADQKEASAHMHKTIASQAATSAYFITGSDKRQLGSFCQKCFVRHATGSLPARKRISKTRRRFRLAKVLQRRQARGSGPATGSSSRSSPAGSRASPIWRSSRVRSAGQATVFCATR